MQQSGNYVQPSEKPIGLKWQSKVDPAKSIVEHKLIQTKFSYVSIHETIHALFSNREFEEIYVKYNTELKHTCVAGMYQDFFCGSSRNNHTVFQSPVALQIQSMISNHAML